MKHKLKFINQSQQISNNFHPKSCKTRVHRLISHTTPLDVTTFSCSVKIKPRYHRSVKGFMATTDKFTFFPSLLPHNVSNDFQHSRLIYSSQDVYDFFISAT